MVLLLALPATGQEQEVEPFLLELEASSGGVRVAFGDFLGGSAMARSLQAGLPIRVQVVAELWRDRLLDSQEGRYEWRAAVRFDPLVEIYRIETEDGAVLQATSPGEIAGLLNDQISVPLRPGTPGRHYYLARLELETVSQSDLEELRRWLQGELAPAVGGDDDVGSALGRGIRQLFLRLLGLPSERFEARTPRFTWPE